MKILKDIKNLKKEIAKEKAKGKIIGFVPTMGAIHSGHLQLVKEAHKNCDLVVVSIFVNQKQFNNSEDYKNYPKTLTSDIKKLQKEADILFIPEGAEIYGENFCTTISLGKLTNNLCGASRPGHFDGVALIVTKLFNIVKPDIAVFGQKDFQQLQIIRKLISDLNFDIKIIAAEIVREKDGLAMSSRNLRLDKISRKIAPNIYKLLTAIKTEILQNKNSNIQKILNEARKTLEELGFGKIDYLEICDEENLKIIKKFNPKIKSRIFIAVYLNQIRLIDNIKLY